MDDFPDAGGRVDCLEFRRRVGSEPGRQDVGLKAHEAECAGCRAFAESHRALDSRLADALRFDVAAVCGAATRSTAPQQHRHGAATSRGRRGWLAVAAALVAAVAFWIGFQPFSTHDNAEHEHRLIAEVVNHIHLEPAPWTPGRPRVDGAEVSGVLERSGNVDVDQTGLGPITYVMSCVVNGRRVPHFAIQGAHGPVMLLLMAEESISRPLPIEVQGYSGVILPVGDGSIAIVGRADEPLEPLIARVRGSVFWRG